MQCDLAACDLCAMILNALMIEAGLSWGHSRTVALRRGSGLASRRLPIRKQRGRQVIEATDWVLAGIFPVT